ncbi:C-terminal binding protein [Halalkalibacter akibai]|uniref:D-3-phosphoglycerate dehydrogenase n=1 Tax=Halalkalibacter akibai (strain ATCC 43226 / DSM 21942 / CIP 109018 / JCM 9157 / 1139) TaxID=1236973 RepID=W4QQW4_HALA3|nr:C-terminal binding protein [Halalkalibacter akibai]GAE33744.1 D-3-phosphoglycerate dehydrogenase [Halalkalibacter akibai JCM 9157]
MSTFKVVVTDYEFATLAPEQEVLSQVEGVEFVAVQCRTEDEVIAAAKDADGLINQYAPITRKVIESLPNLKVVSRYGVGVNTIDIDAATEHGVMVGNVTDYCMDEVSDHAFALIMACARKVVLLNEAVKAGNWDFKVSVPIFRLRGRVLGLIGLGRIPQSLAQKAQAFGMKVVAYDPFVPADVAAGLNVELLELNDLCAQADFVSVHAPLIDATKGMIGEEQFKAMKKEAFIVNTARGPVIDEKALIAALQQGEIAGAGLDVVEEEPIQADNPLLKMDNVILNPHVAWYSEEAQLELKRKTAQNVADVLSGYYPTYLFNTKVKEKVELKQKG